MSPGNLSNIARRAHGNALLPVAFLPIPKSEYFVLYLHLFWISLLQQVNDSGRSLSIKSFVDNFTMPAYPGFSIPLRPECQYPKLSNVLMAIFVERYMGLGRTLRTIRNRFGCRELFKAGVQSTSHLSCGYFHWEITPVSRCLAKPNFLDDASARRRTHEKTEFLINSFNPGILWDDFGIRNDVLVSQLSQQLFQSSFLF